MKFLGTDNEDQDRNEGQDEDPDKELDQERELGQDKDQDMHTHSCKYPYRDSFRDKCLDQGQDVDQDVDIITERSRDRFHAMHAFTQLDSVPIFIYSLSLSINAIVVNA